MCHSYSLIIYAVANVDVAFLFVDHLFYKYMVMSSSRGIDVNVRERVLGCWDDLDCWW